MRPPPIDILNILLMILFLLCIFIISFHLLYLFGILKLKGLGRDDIRPSPFAKNKVL